MREGGDCRIVVTSDAPWLRVELLDESRAIRLLPRREALVSGVLVATVTVATEGGEGPSSEIAVEMRAWEPAPVGAPRRVLIIGVDGVRSDAFELAETPTFDRLRAGASWTLSASTQLTAPTVSGPGWASILTGAEPAKHGVVDNNTLGAIDTDTWPTFFARAAGAGYRTALASQWIQLPQMVEPAYAQGFGFGDATMVSDWMIARLRGASADFHFIHFDDVDHAGHETGFSPENPAYIAAIESVDAHAADLLDALLERPGIAAEEWLVAMTTDHGGSGTQHGALDADNRTIPTLFAGPALPSGELSGNGLSHLDVHPTVMAFLGVEPDASWNIDGRVAVRASE